MAILSQILPPEEISRLTPEKVELLSGLVHAQLMTNKTVHEELAKSVRQAHRSISAA